MTESPSLSHVDSAGRARMVDIGDKPYSARTALAMGRVRLNDEAFYLVSENQIHKGDVLAVGEIAGVMGAKYTSKLIPLCHSIYIQDVQVDLNLNESTKSIELRAFVKTTGQTGVEMEALTAVSIAALAVYDMCKSVSKEIEITDIRLLAKTGGQSGDFRREYPDG